LAVGVHDSIGAGQRRGNVPSRPQVTSGLCVATEDLSGVAKPSAFVRTEALSGRASSRNVSGIADSMRSNGWQGPPIKTVSVDDELYVVDGHHRLAAARQVGIDVPYDVVDPATVIGPGSWTSIDDILRDAFSVGRDRLR
jgi:hypothetical protein